MRRYVTIEFDILKRLIEAKATLTKSELSAYFACYEKASVEGYLDEMTTNNTLSKSGDRYIKK